MLTLASALLALTLSGAPPKIYIDPRVKAMAEEEKAMEKQFVDKQGRRDEKGMCKAGCQQVVSMCFSNCRGQKTCKDNCTNTVEKNCLKGCATKPGK